MVGVRRGSFTKVSLKLDSLAKRGRSDPPGEARAKGKVVAENGQG
jgi:hypothetical protein